MTSTSGTSESQYHSNPGRVPRHPQHQPIDRIRMLEQQPRWKDRHPTSPRKRKKTSRKSRLQHRLSTFVDRFSILIVKRRLGVEEAYPVQ
jgi:hypothetical protein